MSTTHSIVNNTNTVKEFVYILENFKEYEQFRGNELKFYFLNYIKKEYDFEVINKYVESVTSLKEIEITKIDGQEDIELYRVTLSKIIQKKEMVCKALFLFDNKQKSVVICSDFPARIVSLILEVYVYSLYPFMQRMSISSAEIEAMIGTLLADGYTITSSMLAKKKWWEKVRRSGVEYPSNVPMDKVLSQLKKEKSFIHSIMLNVYDSEEKQLILKSYISREGMVKYIAGSYELFKNTILNRIIENNMQSFELFKDRAKEINKIKPFKVTFSDLPKINPAEITKEFMRVIISMKDISPVIYHEGNPFFYADVTDTKDGSTFRLFFQHSKDYFELILIPQFASSPQALSNFFSVIFNQFGEGKIEDFHNFPGG